jgi:ATP adenylyltransferase
MSLDPSLLALIAAAHARALKRGAQVPLRIEELPVEDTELPFVATWVSSLTLKDLAAVAAKAVASAPPANPFVPYEQDLYVADLSPTHVLLLNKFPLESSHVLAVTRAYQPQRALLELADLAAISPLFAEADGLMMYNGGRIAGASQEHRHLHFMPTQIAPLDDLFCKVAVTPGPHAVPQFKFPHVLVRFAGGLFNDPEAAAQIHADFLPAAAKCGLAAADASVPAYNILMTRRWMLVVARSQEHFEAEGIKVSVNAFHYGGLVGVREPAHLDVVRRAGLNAILSACSGLAAA